MQFHHSIFYIVFSLCCFSACKDDAAEQAQIQLLIEQKVQEQIAEFKRKNLAKCHKAAMKEAIEKADSIVIARALQLKDTIAVARKPIKPSKPTINMPDDHTPVEPLFLDTLKN